MKYAVPYKGTAVTDAKPTIRRFFIPCFIYCLAPRTQQKGTQVLRENDDLPSNANTNHSNLTHNRTKLPNPQHNHKNQEKAPSWDVGNIAYPKEQSQNLGEVPILGSRCVKIFSTDNNIQKMQCSASSGRQRIFSPQFYRHIHASNLSTRRMPIKNQSLSHTNQNRMPVLGSPLQTQLYAENHVRILTAREMHLAK